MGKSVRCRIVQDIVRKRIKNLLSSGYLFLELGWFVYTGKFHKLVAWVLGIHNGY